MKTGPSSAAALQAQAHLSSKKNQKRVTSTPDNETDIQSGDGDDSFGGLLGAVEDMEDDTSETPSPVHSPSGGASSEVVNLMEVDAFGNSGSRKRTAGMMDPDDTHAQLQRARGQSAVHTPRSSPHHLVGGSDELLSPEQHTDMILNYFISETSQIPWILVNPPANYDPNARIDDDGHTALHWACAMGRTRVIKLLLTAGASIFAPNDAEQTPLMRSVMFSNNYDVRKFPELYELLHRSTLNIDKHNRTVFHHIANLALTKGKPYAARYYMETILSRLSDYPQELADVINFQDEDGETALTLAARARSRRLVKSLLDHGADPKLKNRDFKSCEDYILEDERFRASPTAPGANGASNGAEKVLYSSEAARLAGGMGLSNITADMQALARSYDNELLGKEREIAQAKALLTSIHAEITESSRSISTLSTQVQPLNDKRRELEQLQSTLKTKIEEAMKQGFTSWKDGEEGRESRWRAGQEPTMNGEDYSDLAARTAPANEGEEESLRWEIEDLRRRRAEGVSRLAKAQTEVGPLPCRVYPTMYPLADATQSGTGDKIAHYRKLVASACNGSINDLDGAVDQLLQVSAIHRQKVTQMRLMFADTCLQTLENDSNGALAPPIPTPGSVTWMS